ncbi:hypothetical protein Tco_1571794 [Tanacetum coccineum]
MSTPAHFDSEIPQPLLVVPPPVPSSDDFHLTVGQAHTPATEFEASEPSDTRITSSHSSNSSDLTAPLSPDHPLTQVSPTPTSTRASFHRRTARMAVRTQPTLSLGMSAQIAKASALSLSSFRKSSDLDTKREGSEDEGPSLEDEGSGSEEEEEVAPEGQQ